MNYFRSRLHAIKHALSGIVYILRTQPNSWLHAIATVLVLAISFWLEISVDPMASYYIGDRVGLDLRGIQYCNRNCR